MLASEQSTTKGRAFDTLAFAKRMETVGFTRQQAEALADEQGKLIDERLATKADIEAVRGDVERVRLATKTDIEQLRLSTKADLETGLAATKAAIIMWVMGLGFAQVLAQIATIIGVLKFHV